MSSQVGDDGYETARLAQRRAVRKRRRQSQARRREAGPVETYRSPSQRVGDAAEAEARRFLESAGLVLVARNLSCRQGEIDLIMMDGAILVFLEVRHRAGSRFGGAAASVGIAKQGRIRRAAQFFLTYRWQKPIPLCRFDVVAMDDERISWLKDAFRVPSA